MFQREPIIYCEVKQSKWRMIEEENGPERGEFSLGGQDNEVVHPVIQDIFTGHRAEK